MKLLDLTGKRFSRWLVIDRAYLTGKVDVYWNCRCDCGNERIILGAYLKRGSSKSCGCGRTIIIDGFSREEIKALYSIWAGMMRRCNDTRDRNYKNYGGRGIKVCNEWRDFKCFAIDMGKRPGKLSIDRINNDGNYQKNNCRWADAKTQANNRRKEHKCYKPRAKKQQI